MRINVVTGATGRIGYALCLELKSRGEYVRAIVGGITPKNILDDIADETIIADVTDLDSLVKAFAGAEVVYHLAGKISIAKTDKDELYRINVGGTKNVVEACKQCKVKKLIYTSSVHAVDYKTNTEPLVEKPMYDPTYIVGNYGKSKAEATNFLLASNSDELTTIACMPAGVIGPYTYKLSNISQMIIDVKKGKIPAYFEGGYNYVDTRDVAFALCQAESKGRGGESYLLSGHYMTVRDMLVHIANRLKVKAPKTKIPLWFIRVCAVFAELGSTIAKKQPTLTPYSVYTLNTNCNFDNSKAKSELDFDPRPTEQSLDDEIDFVLEHYVNKQ